MKYAGALDGWPKWHTVLGPNGYKYLVIQKERHKDQFARHWISGTDPNCVDQGDDYMVFRHYLNGDCGIPQGEERREVIAAAWPMVLEG